VPVPGRGACWRGRKYRFPRQTSACDPAIFCGGAEIERSRLMSTGVSRSTSDSMGGRTSGRPLNIGPSTTCICVSMIMLSPAVRLGIPVMSTPIAAWALAAETLPSGVICASSVNEDSGINPLRFSPSGKLPVKSLRAPAKPAKCDIMPRRCLRPRVIAKSCIGCSGRVGPHRGAPQTRAMSASRVKDQETNGEIAGATSVPGPVLVCIRTSVPRLALACMREVMAKERYTSALFVKGFCRVPSDDHEA
jgi:hypothetical protein